VFEKKIADKIREIRKERGLTLARLAADINLSAPLLSRIENNRISPPIATLAKIAAGLDVPIGVFFQEEDFAQSYAVTTKEGRRPVVRRGTTIGFTYHSLTGLKRPHAIEPFIIKYPLTKKEPGILFDHQGEEFLFVLEGQIDLVYGKEKIRLKEGDAIHFDPSVPHRGQNAGDAESTCLVVVVNSPPLKGYS